MADFILIRDDELAVFQHDKAWYPYAPHLIDFDRYYTPFGFIIPASEGVGMALDMLTRIDTGKPLWSETSNTMCYLIDHDGRLNCRGYTRKGLKVIENKGPEILPTKLFARGSDKTDAEILYYALHRTPTLRETIELLDKVLCGPILDNTIVFKISDIVETLNERFPLPA